MISALLEEYREYLEIVYFYIYFIIVFFIIMELFKLFIILKKIKADCFFCLSIHILSLRNYSDLFCLFLCFFPHPPPNE